MLSWFEKDLAGRFMSCDKCKRTIECGDDYYIYDNVSESLDVCENCYRDYVKKVEG